MANLGKMMKQAQAMQAKVKKAQAELAETERTYTAGGGAVEVTAKGDYTITSIKISPEAVDPEDVEGLEDLLLTAMNGALEEIRQLAESSISQAAGGMNLGGLFG